MSVPPAISSTFPPVSCLYNLQNHDQSTRSWKPPNYSRPWPSLYLESLKTFVVFTALLALRVRGIYILISELHSKFSSADASQASFCIFWTASFWDSLSLCILPLLSLTMASSHGLYLPDTHSQHWLLEAPSLRKKKKEKHNGWKTMGFNDLVLTPMESEPIIWKSDKTHRHASLVSISEPTMRVVMVGSRGVAMSVDSEKDCF